VATRSVTCGNAPLKALAVKRPGVPERVGSTDPEGVDYGRVMQITFVATIVVGAPLVALLSAGADLPSWEARAGFAVRVGAVVWLVTGVTVYAIERRQTDG
jgi:hypothetical protein